MTDIKEQTISEEQLLNLGVGTAEPEKSKLDAKEVLVTAISLATVKGSSGRPDWKKIVLSCKHPDREELIAISQVQIIKDKAIKTTALAFDLDKDGKLAKWSATAQLLNFYKIPEVKKLQGLKLQTVEDDKGYLVIKAY